MNLWKNLLYTKHLRLSIIAFFFYAKVHLSWARVRFLRYYIFPLVYMRCGIVLGHELFMQGAVRWCWICAPSKRFSPSESPRPPIHKYRCDIWYFCMEKRAGGVFLCHKHRVCPPQERPILLSIPVSKDLLRRAEICTIGTERLEFC